GLGGDVEGVTDGSSAGRADGFDRRGDAGLVKVGDDHDTAPLGQEQGGRAADAGGRPRDEGDLAGGLGPAARSDFRQTTTLRRLTISLRSAASPRSRRNYLTRIRRENHSPEREPGSAAKSRGTASLRHARP